MESQIQQLNRLRNSEAALQKQTMTQSKQLRDLTQKLEKTQKENKSLAKELETKKQKTCQNYKVRWQCYLYRIF